jgi:hypothetical protein
MDDEIFIPPIIQKMVDRLIEDTGIQPIVHKYVNGLLLDHENEHVRMTIHYRLQGRRWQHCGSTLTIDGVKQKLLAHDYADYIQVFKLGRRQKLTDGAEKIELPDFPETDPESAPAAVRTALAHQKGEARRRGADGEYTVSLRRDGETYVIQLDLKILTIYLHYGLRHGEWDVVWETGYVLAVSEEGYDVSQKLIEVGGDVLALLDLMGHEMPETDLPRQINHSADPKRLNSVEVRNTSVMRI